MARRIVRDVAPVDADDAEVLADRLDFTLRAAGVSDHERGPVLRRLAERHAGRGIAVTLRAVEDALTDDEHEIVERVLAHVASGRAHHHAQRAAARRSQ